MTVSRFDAWIPAPEAAQDNSLPIRNPVIRELLAARGVRTAEEFRRFTAPEVGDLHDGRLIDGMDAACERIERAISGGEQILIYGDYDVDGVTSIVLLQTVLRILGAEAGYVVPHRLVDGYGLKLEVLQRALEERDVRVVITVDCGITSVEPVERAIEMGIDVIVTDHHLPPDALPRAVAILNPKKPGCEYPYKDLAGVGVTFKLCCELLRRAGREVSIESLAKIAALGTIADVAPLTGENRTIARMGLSGLRDPRNPGLRALLRNLGMLGRSLRGRDVGFRIAPRFNAAGRLASADTAIRLFETRDEGEVIGLLAELERLNGERRTIQDEVTRQVMESIGPDPARVVVAGREGWHKGVLGLCASRVVESVNRPALIVRLEEDRCFGSARSIPTVDLHGLLSRIADVFEHFGGHSYACGFTLRRDRWDELCARMEEVALEIPDEAYRRTIGYDAEIRLADVDETFAEDVDLLEPFGADNPDPVFLLRNVTVEQLSNPFPDRFEMQIRDDSGEGTAGIWRPGDEELGLLREGSADLLVEVEPPRRPGTRPKFAIRDLRRVRQESGDRSQET